MSENNLKEDYERFKDFENKLFDVKEVTWKSDDDINSKIHYDVLCENYGNEKVDGVMKEINIEIKHLANHEAFLKIAEMLKQ